MQRWSPQDRAVTRLSRGHFAFVRGAIEGLDLRELSQRYLESGEDASPDLRIAKSNLRWIRDELAALARRNARHGVARLMTLAPSGAVADSQPLPTLEAFREERDPGGFYSETDLLKLFQEAFPAAFDRKSTRQARVRERQLEALWWLEQLAHASPHPADAVEGWLDPRLAARLIQADIHTIADLVATINGKGHRWWRTIPRFGETAAGRVLGWLAMNEADLGLSVSARAVDRTAVAVALPKSTAIVPMERLAIPSELDGSRGRYRVGDGLCLLDARNDYEAINAWLSTKREGSPTRRSYRKEAERYLLWAIVQKKKAISSLTTEDCIEYRDFLSDPQPAGRWCAPRDRERWSAEWRPFEGPLAPVSVRQAIAILKAMGEWLMRQRYLLGNAWDGVPPAMHVERKIDTGRSFTQRQWRTLNAHCAKLPDGDATRRLRFITTFAYATGLRVSELAQARTQDLRLVPLEDTDDEGSTAWVLNVRGKGGRLREVPMPEEVMTELTAYLSFRGLDPDPKACPEDTYLIGKLNNGIGPRAALDASQGVTPGMLYTVLKAFFKGGAEASSSPEDAKRMRLGSSHWLRHTHGSHTVAAGVPLEIVQNNLGHTSLNTTTIYVTAERSRRIKAMQQFMGRRRAAKTSP